MRTALWTVIALIASAPACVAAATGGDGLMPWPQWQGRLSLTTSGPARHTDGLALGYNGLDVRGLSLMGDYYFAGPVPGRNSAGGFRATSGLIVGARSSSALFGNRSNFAGRAFSIDHRRAAWASPLPALDASTPEPGAVPYFGVGYTGLSGKGGWGFSADVGLVALSPRSAIKLGRMLDGGQSLDEVLRDMRLSPLVQVGVSYSF